MATFESAEDLHEHVEVLLHRIDQRYTTGRRSIVALLESSGRPLSIAEVESALPQVPRSSAYRHLADLMAIGVLRKVQAADQFARYELAEGLHHHHHHLICTQCGVVVDVAPDQRFESVVSAMAAALTEQHGFSEVTHALDIFGRCRTCTANA
jgi:Fur family ferric uptake transcriptional regulator